MRSLREVGKMLSPPVSGSRVQQEEANLFQKIEKGLLAIPEVREYLEERGMI